MGLPTPSHLLRMATEAQMTSGGADLVELVLAGV